MREFLNSEDIIQVVVGASALTVPVAFTEESWRISETLPFLNVFLLMLTSLVFIGLYSVQGIFQGQIKHRLAHYVLRIAIDYFVTVAVVTIILTLLNKFPVADSPVVALKRVIILSFPASMGAVIVDGLDKE